MVVARKAKRSSSKPLRRKRVLMANEASDVTKGAQTVEGS